MMAHFVSRDGLGFSSREEELALINNRSSEYILFDYTLDELMPAMFNLYHPTDLRKLIRPIYNIHFFTQGDNLYICFKNFEFGSLEAISNLSEILKFDDINGAYFINCHFTADTVLDIPSSGCGLYNCIFENKCFLYEQDNDGFSSVEFNFCEFNGWCSFNSITSLSIEIYNSVFNENSKLELDRLTALHRASAWIRLKNIIFKGTVNFEKTIIPAHSIFEYLTFFREVNFYGTHFEPNSLINNISFAPFINQSTKDGFNSFVKALENSSYTNEAEFYAQNVGGIPSTRAINKDELDIAIKSDWVSIGQAADVLGITYNTLLTMRKEDKASGAVRIPFKGEGKKTRYYYPLLIAYKSGDMKRVNELAREMEDKQ